MQPELRDFFTVLLQNTKEGYFADPMYGGNHGMQAPSYIGFPGARGSYKEWVERYNVRYPLGPVSIKGERGLTMARQEKKKTWSSSASAGPELFWPWNWRKRDWRSLRWNAGMTRTRSPISNIPT